MRLFLVILLAALIFFSGCRKPDNIDFETKTDYNLNYSKDSTTYFVVFSWDF